MKTTQLLRCLLLAVVFAGVSFSMVSADDEQEVISLQEAHAKLKATLDDVKNMFYKESKTKSGITYYVVMWEQDGEVSKIHLEISNLGHYEGDPIYGLSTYAVVAQADEVLPPAVIKAAITKNDACGIGKFSMTEDFDSVFFSSIVPSDNLTPAQIWMVCAYTHKNRLEFRAEMKELMSAAGQ